MPMVIPVVKSTTVRNSLGSSYYDDLRLRGGLWDKTEREFSVLPASRPQTRDGNYMVTKFNQDNAYFKGKA